MQLNRGAEGGTSRRITGHGTCVSASFSYLAINPDNFDNVSNVYKAIISYCQQCIFDITAETGEARDRSARSLTDQIGV
jgi:hypothetical protein